MKRIECECGRSVRVEPEYISGDRVICPYCGAALPLPVTGPTGQPDEPAPADKPPPRWVLIAVGGFILVVLLAAAGVGAFVWLGKKHPAKSTEVVSRESEDDKTTRDKKASDKSTKTGRPKIEVYGIKLNPPRKIGDVREVTLSGKEESQFTVVEDGKPTKEAPKSKKYQLHCKVRTLDVDPQGRELAWEFTILGGNVTGMPPAGTVLQAEMPFPGPLGELHFLGAGAKDLSPTVRALLTRAAGQRLGYWLTASDDAMFGIPKEQPEGAAWQADVEALNDWYKGTLNADWIRSVAKLTAVHKGDPVPEATVEIKLAAAAELKEKTPDGIALEGKGINEFTGTVSYHVPLKDSPGPTQVSSTFDITTKDEGKPGVDVGSVQTLHEEYTLTIKYLPSEPVADNPVVNPNPNGVLRQARVKWVPGRSALNVWAQADKGDAPAKKVVLWVVLPGSGVGNLKAYPLRPVSLEANQTLSDSQLTVELPAGSQGERCVLQLREAQDDAPGKVIDSWDVPIHGTPPPARLDEQKLPDEKFEGSFPGNDPVQWAKIACLLPSQQDCGWLRPTQAIRARQTAP